MPVIIRRLIWQDWVMGSGLALNALARLITASVTTTLSAYIQTANIVETNPALQQQVRNSYYFFIASIAVFAFLFAYYLYIRKKRLNGPINEVWFNFVVFLCFIGMLLDAMNDLGIFIGLHV